MNGLLITFHLIVCIMLILIVLLQVGRGAELGAAFGSIGQAQNQRGQFTFMSKVTTTMAILFMVTSFTLTYQSANSRNDTALENVEARTTETTEAPAPAVPVEAPATDQH